MKWFKEDKSQYTLKFSTIGNEEVVLIRPINGGMGHDWNDDNKIYQSSMWTVADGRPVSLGFKKFVNYNERPNFEKIDILNDNPVLVNKEDGSLLIVSEFNGELIIRTRGTFDVAEHRDGHIAIQLVKDIYPQIKDLLKEHSLLFEFVSVLNQIVVKYDKAQLFLIGCVRHEDYTYLKQELLDNLNIQVERPKTFTIKDMTFESLKNFVDENNLIREGLVCYFNGDQILKKVKCDSYLRLHSVRCSNNTKKVYQRLAEICYESFDTFSECISSEFIETFIEEALSVEYDFETVEFLLKTALVDDLHLFINDIKTFFDEYATFTKACKDFKSIDDVVKYTKDNNIKSTLIFLIFKQEKIRQNSFLKAINKNNLF